MYCEPLARKKSVIPGRGLLLVLLFLFFLFLFDVFLAGVAQTALPFLFAAASALLGVLLAVCKIVVSHIFYVTTDSANLSNNV